MKTVLILFLLTASYAFAQARSPLVNSSSFTIEQSMNSCKAPMQPSVPASTLRLVLEERVERLANARCVRQNVLAEAELQGDYEFRPYLCGATILATYSCALAPSE